MNASTIRAALWLVLFVLGGLVPSAVALGQTENNSQPPSDTNTVSPQNEANENQNQTQPPELPPVIVRPPEEEAVPGDAADLSSPFNAPYEYPSLYPGPSERFLDSLTGNPGDARSIFDDPRHVTVIDRTDLEERQPVDMAQALEREVGVLIQRTGQGRTWTSPSSTSTQSA